MSRLTSKRKKEVRDSPVISNRIRRRFKELNISLSKKTEGVPTDLGDIHEIFRQFTGALDLLYSSKAQNDEQLLLEIFKSIRNDFYIHLNYHLRELKKPLDMIIEELEEGK